MAAPTYVGVAPLSLVDCTNGATVYVYRNGPVPADAKAEQVERLLNIGFIVEAPQVGGLEPMRAGDGSPLSPVGAAMEAAVPVMPAKSASKALWVEFAEHLAADDPEQLAAIDAMTKDDLIEQYGATV